MKVENSSWESFAPWIWFNLDDLFWVHFILCISFPFLVQKMDRFSTHSFREFLRFLLLCKIHSRSSLTLGMKMKCLRECMGRKLDERKINKGIWNKLPADSYTLYNSTLSGGGVCAFDRLCLALHTHHPQVPQQTLCSVSWEKTKQVFQFDGLSSAAAADLAMERPDEEVWRTKKKKT